MSPPSRQRSRFIRNWFEQWSWIERAIVALLSLLVFAALIVGERAGSWLAGIFALAAFMALQIVVFRHGGWCLVGPHFYYDVVRLARRGRSTLLRCAYILALLAGLALVYERVAVHETWRPNDFAEVSERFAFMLFFIQNLAVVLLTPAYLASAITEEKERRTLELLFTTQLTDTEIILGKLFSRIIHLFGFVIAGLPVLSLIQFWGGIDMVLIAGNLFNTLLNILSVGSICLLVSALSRTVSGAVMASYAMVLPVSFCCVSTLEGFPFVLQDARQGGPRVVSVQDVGILAILHFLATAMCLALARAALRNHQAPEYARIAGTMRLPDPLSQETTAPEPAKPQKGAERVDALGDSYKLPPVSDNAMLWKERYLGGLALQWKLLPAFPFVAWVLPLVSAQVVIVFVGNPEEHHHIVDGLGKVLRFFYYVFLAFYVVGVAYRATGSVARERQQQTLEPLLLLPIDRVEILRAKWLGSLMRGWHWLALILVDIVLGTLIGAYHPFTVVLWCLAPWPMIFFFASIGLFLSVVMTTVLRANLAMVLVAVLFITCANSMVVPYGPFAYLETFASPLRGDIILDTKERLILAAGTTFVYLFAAAGLWMLTVLLFEKRTRQSEI